MYPACLRFFLFLSVIPLLYQMWLNTGCLLPYNNNNKLLASLCVTWVCRVAAAH